MSERASVRVGRTARRARGRERESEQEEEQK
jgi:hypothetical protein